MPDNETVLFDIDTRGVATVTLNPCRQQCL